MRPVQFTEMRTGAVTAIGARELGRSDAEMLGHIGARRTAYWEVRLIDSLFGLDEIRVEVVVDDWGQCRAGRFGSLRGHVDAGRLSKATLHAELARIAVGDRRGREDPGERWLLWHRGLSLSDIAPGAAVLDRAEEEQRGTNLRLI